VKRRRGLYRIFEEEVEYNAIRFLTHITVLSRPRESFFYEANRLRDGTLLAFR